MTKNDWLTHNLLQRREHDTIPFTIDIKPSFFENTSFEYAANSAALDMAAFSDKLYVSLSGGLDSEFVMKTFLNYRYLPCGPVIPVIVICEGNELEREYAFRFCKENNIKPDVINLTNKDLINLMADVKRDVNGCALYSLATVAAARHAKENGGKLVTGDHFVDDPKPRAFASINEWDFYSDIIDPDNYHFFVHTPELTWAMLNELRWMTDDVHLQKWKATLYKLEYRPKLKYAYNQQVYNVITRIQEVKPTPPYNETFELNQFMSIIRNSSETQTSQ